MKNRQKTSKGIALTYILGAVTLGLFGQNLTADKKIAEIEFFKKYVITLAF